MATPPPPLPGVAEATLGFRLLQALAKIAPPWWKRRRFKPRISTARPDCREVRPIVIEWDGQRTAERAMTLRLWLYNGGGQQCSVFVERISYQGKTVEDVRSPLQWTYPSGIQPKTVNDPFDEGCYVELATGRDSCWMPASERAYEMFKRFLEPGVYTIHLAIEAPALGARHEETVTVVFHVGNHERFDFFAPAR